MFYSYHVSCIEFSVKRIETYSNYDFSLFSHVCCAVGLATLLFTRPSVLTRCHNGMSEKRMGWRLRSFIKNSSQNLTMNLRFICIVQIIFTNACGLRDQFLISFLCPGSALLKQQEWLANRCILLEAL